MLRDFRKKIALVLSVIIVASGMPSITYGQNVEQGDPFEMMVDTTPDLMSAEEIIESICQVDTSQSAITAKNVDIEPSDYDDIEAVKDIIEDTVEEINQDSMDVEIDEMLLDDILERQQELVENSKTDRFIVKYKDGGEEDFAEKLEEQIYKTVGIEILTSENAVNQTNNNSESSFLDSAGELIENAIDSIGFGNEQESDIQLVMLHEKVNPNDFVQDLREADVAENIEYIQPDFEMEMQKLDEEEIIVEETTSDEEVAPINNDETSSGENLADELSTEEAITTTPENQLITDEAIIEESEIVDTTSEGSLIELQEETTQDAIVTEEAIIEESQKTIIAIIDTGMDITHPDLEKYIYTNPNEIPNNGIDDDRNGYVDDINGWNFTDNTGVVFDEVLGLEQSHATHIAGIVAGASDADEELIPNENIQILPLKVFCSGTAYTSSIIAAIEYADSIGAKVLNCSFGSTYQNQALKEAMEKSNALFVSAAGNARTNLDEKPVYPASFDLANNISVTSVNKDGGLSYFSDYGEASVNIAALGRDVDSTLPFGERGLMTGTSMSAGVVSSAAGRIFSENQDLDANQVKLRLISCADKISSLVGSVRDAAKLNVANCIDSAIQVEIKNIEYIDDFNAWGFQNVNDAIALFNAVKNIKVEAGRGNSVVLKEDGTVWAWGSNNSGQCGNGNVSPSETLKKVTGLSSVVDISSCGEFSYALKSNGTVWGWGINMYSQLGSGSYKSIPVQINGLTNVKKISAGPSHSIAVKTDGTVWVWGSNRYGELGDGTTIGKTTPTQVSSLTNVSDISAGYNYSVVLKADGTVWTFGKNDEGQLGDGTTTNKVSPVQISGLNDIQSVSAGYYHCMGLKSDKTAWAWGKNFYGQLGDGAIIAYRTSPVRVGALSNVSKISGGENYSLLLTSDGSVWGCGYNLSGQLGSGSISMCSSIPLQVTNLTNVKEISAGYYSGLALKTDGAVWAWGENEWGQIGDNSIIYTKHPYKVNTFAGLTKIELGKSEFGLGLKADKTVLSWGDNYEGQLGDGSNSKKTTPVQVVSLSAVSSISAGSRHSLALKTNGTVWSWGSNSNGQLGCGTTASKTMPVQVSGLTNVKEIACGGYHSLALKTDGTVWSWGSNSNGQLGDGTIVNKTNPVQISGLVDVSQIFAGSDFSLALKIDGTIWAWGSNWAGQLGNGTTINQTTPVQVSGLNDVKEIACGGNHNLAIRTDGTVWSWGKNGVGQLGNGTTANQTTPVQVSGLTDVKEIACGGNHNLAIKTDGTVWSWGENNEGQLGDGSLINKLIPSKISNITNAAQLSAGYESSIINTVDGVYSFGSNSNGVIGLPITAKYSTPVEAWTGFDDFGDTFNTGTEIFSTGGAFEILGSIDHFSDVDVFFITANKTAAYYLETIFANGNGLKVTLYNNSMTYINTITNDTSVNLTQGLKYYIKIENDNTQYQFITKTPYTVKLIEEIRQINGGREAITLNCKQGEEIYVPYSVIDAYSLRNIIFKLKYDTNDLEVIDLVCQTKDLETSSGMVTNSGIEIIAITSGEITFRVSKKININEQRSGNINIFKFKSKITGQTELEAESN